MQKQRNLHILDATYAGNLAVKLVFSDKHISVVNIGEWVRQHPHPQYNRFLDEAKFRKFYLDDMGNVAWGKNRDLYFPIEQLYKGQLSSY